MQKWKDIWRKKTWQPMAENPDEFALFCELKKADGFDVAVSDEEEYYRYFYEKWNSMYQTIASVAKQPIRSVFEVGCGSGVNLMLFQNRGVNLLGGIDYSESLIDVCRKIVRGEVFCQEADSIDTEQKFDIVLADSVFQYFPTVDYADAVLDKMLAKASEMVVLCEIHDLEKKEECISYRKSVMENYDSKYEGLDKLFLSKKWIEDKAAKNGKKVRFTENVSDVYWNSRYIYDAYLYE